MSARFTLNTADWQKWSRNTLLFFAPVAIIYLSFFLGNLNDGLQASDFVPNSFFVGSMATYLASTMLDLIRKFVAGK